MRNKVFKMLQEKLKIVLNDENIISVFIVGSMADNDYEMKKFNDFDIRFIVKEMNANTYDEIMNLLNQVKLDILKENIGCEVSDFIGPVKMFDACKQNILIHGITLTKEELDRLPNIHKYSYSQNYTNIHGEDLINQYKKIILLPEDVILSTEGIDFCIDLINNKNISGSRWIKDNDKMILTKKTKNATDEEMIEIFYYSYHKSINNINNMIITNNLNDSLDNYLNFSKDEKQLIEKLNTNSLKPSEISDYSVILVGILYKLEKICLEIYKKNKVKFHNSLDWGILTSDTKEQRKKGFDFLKKVGLKTGNNFSVSYEEYILMKDKINARINGSNYIVIFDPPGNNFERVGITNVKSIEDIDNCICNIKYDLASYNISFIEKIKELKDSFAGVAMSDGKGKIIIETINQTCDSRELTSTGAMSSRINNYFFDSFDNYTNNIPNNIRKIKNICQFFKGYYEFAYGEIRNNKDIYFTYYSDEDKYINIFEGGKVRCKNFMK